MTACEDNTFWVNVFDFLNINGVRKNFAIHIALTNSSCNQLIVLTAEIKNNDSFFCSIAHSKIPFKFKEYRTEFVRYSINILIICK